MMHKDIIFFVVIIKIITGQIMWFLEDKPAVFGTDIKLVCLLSNNMSCCRRYNRKWNVGSKNTLKIINDNSLNKTKYCEQLDETSHTSILTIKTLSVEDVNIPYECVYGFKKYGAILELTKDGYEFHPKEKLPVIPTISRNKIHLNVTFQLVYPVPLCSAMFGLNKISSELNVSSRRHGVLYMSTIELDYTISSTECGNSLRVTCLVGQTVLTVTDFMPCACSSRVFSLIATGVAVFVTVFLVLLIMVVIYKKRRNDNSNSNAEEREKLRNENSHNSNMSAMQSKDKIEVVL